jgi:CheY-like chemotaxis protein
MASVVWVKVVGFSDMERHSINTLFRLSEGAFPAYALWTPETKAAPNVLLLDVESYEAGLDMVSPSFNAHLKCICVGDEPIGSAWRSFARPVDWPALIRVLDGLFTSLGDVDIDIGLDNDADKPVPPGVRVSLMVGMSREERLYLRARLAIAGLTDVDEVDTAREANARTVERRYDLVVVGLEVRDADPWDLVENLKHLPEPPHAVLVASRTPSWRSMERAEQLGCLGLLEIPFNPQQLMGLLHKV